MRLDSRSGVRGLLQNLDTGEVIRYVRWAEIPETTEQQGEFEAFHMNPEHAKAQGIPLSEIIYRGKARLRFIPAAPRIGVNPTSQRDLAGSLEEGRRRHAVRIPPPHILIPGRVPIPECETPGCHQPAWWKVSDEVEIEPARDADGNLFERAVTQRAHYYCEKCYRQPTFTNARGVQSEVEVEEGRPQ